MNQKFTSTIAGASIFISIMAILSRSIGFLREMIFAGYFGTGSEFDLYLVGAVLPVTINSIILYAGQNFLVPLYQKKHFTDNVETKKLYNQSFFLFVSAGVLIGLIFFLFSDLIINLYMQNAPVQTKETALIVFKIFIITIPLSAGISVLTTILQTLYEFKYPAISVLFLNISIILLLILFTNRLGVYIIPIGYMIGTLLQFIYLLYKAKTYLNFKRIINLKQSFLLKYFFGSTLVFILLIESIGQLYSIFDRYFYSHINPGGIASLNYAYIIFVLPITIFSISLATVVFPKITSAISSSTHNEIERIYNESLAINLFIFIPITFILFYFGDTIVKIAFERGKFLTESTSMTFSALRFYSISLVFYSIYSILNKILYSINLAKILLVITLIGMIIKLVFNILLVKNYQQNGLAISTSISYLFFFTSSYLIINSKMKLKHISFFVKKIIIYIIDCIVCLLTVWILNESVFNGHLIINLMLMFLFVVIYLLNLYLLKDKGINLFKQVLQKISFAGFIK
jgi:putative peptidoglycan lipid II flippase